MKLYPLLPILILLLTMGPLACGDNDRTPTPTVSLSISELKYRVIDQFGGMEEFTGIHYCDPDLYPIGVSSEELTRRAVARFPEIRGNTEEFESILNRLGLSDTGDFTDEQKVASYQEDKKLRAITLQRDDGRYSFDVAVSEGDRPGFGFDIRGAITSGGSITILKQESIVIPTCPICLPGDTRIDTPTGDVPVKDLRPGMLVWSIDALGSRCPAVVQQSIQIPVSASHRMVRITLDDGRELTASPGHPTSDGRVLGAVVPGDLLDGAHVLDVAGIPYEDGFTFDILPSGSTGFYWANGILVGSAFTASAL